MQRGESSLRRSYRADAVHPRSSAHRCFCIVGPASLQIRYPRAPARLAPLPGSSLPCPWRTRWWSGFGTERIGVVFPLPQPRANASEGCLPPGKSRRISPGHSHRFARLRQPGAAKAFPMHARCGPDDWAAALAIAQPSLRHQATVRTAALDWIAKLVAPARPCICACTTKHLASPCQDVRKRPAVVIHASASARKVSSRDTSTSPQSVVLACSDEPIARQLWWSRHAGPHALHCLLLQIQRCVPPWLAPVSSRVLS